MGRYSAPCRENMSLLTTSHVGPLILFSAVLLYNISTVNIGNCCKAHVTFAFSSLTCLLYGLQLTSEDFAEKFKKVNCV